MYPSFEQRACFALLPVSSRSPDRCGGETARSCASAGRRKTEGLLDRGRPGGFSTTGHYSSTDLTLFHSGSSITVEKGANSKELQGCEVRMRV